MSVDTLMTEGGRKKNTAKHHLLIYTLAQAQNALLICRESLCSLQEMTVSRKKKNYNLPLGNDLCDVGILNEGEDIHNICQIAKKKGSNSSIYLFLIHLPLSV